MRKPTSPLLAGTACLFLAASQVSVADDDDTKAAIAAAAVALGIVALAHNEHHHKNGEHSSNSNDEAEYERGFNDALYNMHYDTSSGEAYNDGYNAGKYEREHRVTHYRRSDTGQSSSKAPSIAQRSCIGEASAQWGVNPRDIHAVKSQKIGGDDYYVEVASGYRHGKCEVSGEGEIFLLEDGRI